MFQAAGMYWIGARRSGLGAKEREDLEAAIRRAVGTSELLAEGACFELIGPDPRGDFGPGLLTVFDLVHSNVGVGDLSGATAEVERLMAPEICWRASWHRLAEVGAAIVPDSVYLVGIDAPEGSSEEDLVAFNTFYSDVHLDEARTNLRYSQGVRFERDPNAGGGYKSPRFLATYLGDPSRRHQTIARGTGHFSSGPQVWERHVTPWRLTYGRIAAVTS